MIKNLLAILLIALVLTSCSSAQAIEGMPAARPPIDETVTVTSSQVEEATPAARFLAEEDMLAPINEKYGSIPGDELTDEQISEMAMYLIQKGHEIRSFYHWSFKSEIVENIDVEYILQVPNQDGEGYATYYRRTVVETSLGSPHWATEHSTIQELKDATESVFSRNRCEQSFFHLLDWHFGEFGGVLYSNADLYPDGVSIHIFDTNITSIVSKEPERIEVRTEVTPAHYVSPAYAYIIFIRERGRWVLDNG